MISLALTIILPGLLSPILNNEIEVVPTLSVERNRMILFNLLYISNILLGVYTVTKKRNELIFGVFLGIVSLFFIIYNMNASATKISSIVGLMIVIFYFSYLFYKSIRQIFEFEGVDMKTIFASMCGYLLIGLIATMTFSLIGLLVDNSFSVDNVEPYNMIYFSFVTITTIGYGDITPISPTAQSLAIFFGVTGQLYLTVLIAFLVGKYVSSAN